MQQQITDEVSEAQTAEQPEKNIVAATKEPKKEDDLEAVQSRIDGYGIGTGPMSAMTVRVLRNNKPRDLWTLPEAIKILEEIKKSKGEK